MDYISANLDPSKKIPLYLQLHDYIALEISSGRVKEGERLPGKRTASKLLGISQSTVDGAYQLLTSEGYVISKPRSGFVVCRLEQLEAPPVFDASAHLTPKPTSSAAYSFLTGSIDESLFPFRTWGRLFKDTLYNRPDLLNHGNPCGDDDLREAISLYLHHGRGVYCHSDNIIIGAGMEYLLGLLCHILKGNKVAVEDPGYPKIHQILSSGGMDVCFVNLDSQGIDPSALAESGAGIAYLTPSHQFPTGIVTPAGRRTELLKWAAEKDDRYIIEDDYDSEFRFDGRPMPCMQSMSPSRVIYIGTFSRTIAPAIRVAYMALPPKLMAIYKNQFSFFSSTVSRFEQQTLYRYISEGHFGRSLNKMRSQYKLRRDTLMDNISKTFGPSAVMVNTHTGLSFLLKPDIQKSEREIEASAQRSGLRIRGLKSYCFSNVCPFEKPCLVLGFGALKTESIPTAVEMLYSAVYRG
ncbi:MAG: PLP-dependent aminotransferase family protein [Clostridiaceae bacterium]|nr:PLP-dependent aminotransferase family protein [Clostridiaceae bacterium]